ncbi:dihydrodipicolinate reductase C-terminal domain-containing protein [Micromonospora echinofusca]|uniref:4-hydroxy-tetrahydrodipicolinate reductase n=1 Tax=Micromonospora echinofusca TaxID=47858 RepID=UPI000C70A016
MALPTVVCGRNGRMANLLAGAVRDTTDLALAGRLCLRDPAGPPADGVFTSLAALPAAPAVVVDFTHRAGTVRLLRAAEDTPCALVVGTSGLTGTDQALLRRVARRRPVLQAANFSLVMALLRRFVGELAQALDDRWDAAVVDVHHARKVDAPSATASALARAWGTTRAAPPVSSLRFGDAVSEHRLLAGGAGEQIELAHRVNERSAFVPGVLAAVRFAGRAAPGLYSLEDALCG